MGKVELIIDVLFLLVVIKISVIDIKKRVIPNKYTLILIGISIINSYMVNNNVEMGLLGMGYYSLIFSIIYGYVSDIYKRDVIGYGDIKLAMGIGFFLGYRSLIEGYLFFILSFILGSFYILYLKIAKKNKGEELPFAPFISMSGIIIMVLRWIN